MVVLALLYMLQSISECVKGAQANRSMNDGVVVCDLPIDFKQLALLIVGTLSSAAMLAYKISLCEQVRLRVTIKNSLKAQRATLLAEGAAGLLVPAAAAGGRAAQAAMAQSAAAPASSGVPTAQVGASSALHHAAEPADVQFLGARTPAPPASGHALANVEHGNVNSEAPTVRGICDCCGIGVLGSDNGRVREGEKYYHAQCVKGQCGGCGLVVHSDANRENRGGVYWHIGCLY
jgi:hypothetical protein